MAPYASYPHARRSTPLLAHSAGLGAPHRERPIGRYWKPTRGAPHRGYWKPTAQPLAIRFAQSASPAGRLISSGRSHMREGNAEEKYAQARPAPTAGPAVPSSRATAPPGIRTGDPDARGIVTGSDTVALTLNSPVFQKSPATLSRHLTVAARARITVSRWSAVLVCSHPRC
jgi:hypothetical protein